MISIIMSTIEREFYLRRFFESFRLLGGWDKTEFEMFLIVQGSPLSMRTKTFIELLPFAKNIKTGYTEKIQPIGTVIRDTLDRVKYPIVFKIDDDCSLMSMDFLPRIEELCAKLPKSIVYPYIVDGETPLPAHPSKNQCIFLERCNLHITLGEAPLSSGKYIAPTELLKHIPFNQQNDAELIRIASLRWHLPVFQAQNGLVIEIQEGLSGQYYRKNQPNGQQC